MLAPCSQGGSSSSSSGSMRSAAVSVDLDDNVVDLTTTAYTTFRTDTLSSSSSSGSSDEVVTGGRRGRRTNDPRLIVGAELDVGVEWIAEAATLNTRVWWDQNSARIQARKSWPATIHSSTNSKYNFIRLFYCTHTHSLIIVNAALMARPLRTANFIACRRYDRHRLRFKPGPFSDIGCGRSQVSNLVHRFVS